MEFNRFSKSLYSTAMVCPWKAWMHHVKRVRDEPGPAALDGIEIHELWGSVLSGKLDLRAALDKASNDEVRTLLERAVTEDPYAGRKQRHFELHVRLDRKGRITNSQKDTLIHGFLDHVIPNLKGVVLVEDLKTGRVEKDDPLERGLYALCGFRAYPKRKKLRFSYYFCRSGNRPSHLYEYKDNGRAIAITDEQTGEAEEWESPVEDPLYAWVMGRVKEVEDLPLEARPGDHCVNWYGRPCQFLGNGCAAEGGKGYQTDESLPVPSGVAEVLALPKEKQAGAAWALVRSADEETELPPEILGLALQGSRQLSAWNKQVTSKIRKATKENGSLVPVGESLYGWKPRQELLAEPTISTLLSSGYGADVLSSVLNVSSTSIKKLKRVDPELYDEIMSWYVVDGKPAFGLINEKGE